MEIMSLIGISVVGALICVVLKQYKPEYALAAAICTGIVILIFTVPQLSEIFDLLKDMSKLGEIDMQYSEVVVKALGICIITQLASDTCKDCGQNAIASKVELVGKISVLVISVPVFAALAQTVQKLIDI